MAQSMLKRGQDCSIISLEPRWQVMNLTLYPALSRENLPENAFQSVSSQE